jgi:hypothetical protein
MKKIFRTLMLCLVVMMVASCANMPKRNLDPSMLVIPSRYTIVQLAFDVARLRPVTLVAYDKGSASDELMLHIWNPGLQEWVKIGMDEFSSGNLTNPMAKRVHVLGADADLPVGILEAAQWCPVVKQIDSLTISTIINSLNSDMRFSSSEWRGIAKRHKLTVEDRNSDRRRYGRYGKPGAEHEVPMPEEEIIEEIGGEPMPPVSQDEEIPLPLINPADK